MGKAATIGAIWLTATATSAWACGIAGSAPHGHAVVPAQPRAVLTSLVSNEDYPASALRNGEQGTVHFRLTVGPNGRVTGCAVTGSSGSAMLDATTCRLLRSRARFSPAHDAQGQPVFDTYESWLAWTLTEVADPPLAD